MKFDEGWACLPHQAHPIAFLARSKDNIHQDTRLLKLIIYLDGSNITSRYEVERAMLINHGGIAHSSERSGAAEEVRMRPLISLKARYSTVHAVSSSSTPHHPVNIEHIFPQYNLLGFHDGACEWIPPDEPIIHNTRTPFSTLICGSQGSGKSYTLSCMLENCLSPDLSRGKPGPAQTGLILHYDAGSSSLPSEAASLCNLGIPVHVYVAPTNYARMRARYKGLAGASTCLEVSKLYFKQTQLTIEMLRKMMVVTDDSGRQPLYMYVVQQVLRSFALSQSGKPFDYAVFKTQLNSQNFTREQSGPLSQRLSLLESFLDYDPKSGREGAQTGIFDHSKAGTMTIIDLSCPFVDVGTANTLFDICMGLFKNHRPNNGLVIALDEAHKFISDSGGGLTDQLLTTIREQRHNATRVIIATQEPTISPKLLDLCTVTIIHRFTSPAWYEALAKHLMGAHRSEQDKAALLTEIVNLSVGQSLVFAPSAFVLTREGEAAKLAGGYFKMKTRKRRGLDLGTSKLADENIRPGQVPVAGEKRGVSTDATSGAENPFLQRGLFSTFSPFVRDQKILGKVQGQS